MKELKIGPFICEIGKVVAASDLDDHEALLALQTAVFIGAFKHGYSEEMNGALFDAAGALALDALQWLDRRAMN